LQYVCAGDIRALDCLANVVDSLRSHPVDLDASPVELAALVQRSATATVEKPVPLTLQRSISTTPLHGIDVPFHSSLLRPGVASYRRFLRDKIAQTAVDPRKLIGKWIPNVTGAPFGVARQDFENVFAITGSPVLRDILDRWDSYAHGIVSQKSCHS
jgi:fatty acid synthase subunit beta, fungi type